MKEIEMIVWNQEAKKTYAERTDEMCKQTRVKRKELASVEEKWKRLKRIVHGAMTKKRLKIKEKELGGIEDA